MQGVQLSMSRAFGHADMKQPAADPAIVSSVPDIQRYIGEFEAHTIGRLGLYAHVYVWPSVVFALASFCVPFSAADILFRASAVLGLH